MYKRVLVLAKQPQVVTAGEHGEEAIVPTPRKRTPQTTKATETSTSKPKPKPKMNHTTQQR